MLTRSKPRSFQDGQIEKITGEGQRLSTSEPQLHMETQGLRASGFKPPLLESVFAHSSSMLAGGFVLMS